MGLSIHHMLNAAKCAGVKSVRAFFTLPGWALLALITLTTAYSQTTYYVASNGSDANTGRSASAPFQTLAKVSNLPLQPGDSVLLRRGDTFRGTLTVRQSGSAARPIVYDAYGTGSKPTIAGSVPLTNWTSAGTNRWQASCPDCGSTVTDVYRDGVPLPLGRYPNLNAPNKGNLTIRAHTEKYQIFSLEPLPQGIDWKGAEVVMRPAAWILDRAEVEAQSGDALNLVNNSSYFPRDNSEFFFQNHLATLDQPGEWYYDKATKRVVVYSEQGMPVSQRYTVTVYGRGIDIVPNVQYVRLRNLQINETLNTAVFGRDVSYLTMTGLEVRTGGEDGIIILGSGRDIVLEDSQLMELNNNAVWIDPRENVTVRRNTLRRIAMQAGRGKSGDGQYNGIHLVSDQNVLVEHNTLDGIGYNGIIFNNNTTIRQNIIANYNAIKIDGGGIYAHNGYQKPMSNINILSNILYTNAQGTSPWVDYAIGIFLDDCTENVNIRDNTIFGNTQWGVFLHGASRVTFTGNTLFDNRTCQLVVYHNGGKCPIRGNVIKDNLFVAKTSSQMVAQYESNANDLLQYGTIDSNVYARPFNEQATIRGVINWGQGGNYELKDWQNFSGGHDRQSIASPITYTENQADGAGGVNRVYSTFSQGPDGWELVYSRYGNAEVVFDNTNKLDGGSLRLSFPTPSGQSGSFAQMVKRFGPLKKGKKYVLRFDAVASANVTLLVHLRTYGPPFTEFGRRYYVPLSPNRQAYELIYDVGDNEANAIIMMQTDVEGPVIWVDNVRLQEDVPIGNNPDDYIKLFYNPTRTDSTVVLPAGSYRDARNQVYTGSVRLRPFTSVVLFKEHPRVSAADLSLALDSDKRALRSNETATLRLRVRNESDTPADLTRWTVRLPANCEFVFSGGQPYEDNVLTGTLPSLAPQTDTTFFVRVKPTAAGLFRLSAQITTATSPDPDSSPASGLTDGEDDAATTELRVESASPLFESPNPNQRALPAVIPQPVATDSTKADLSLQLVLSRRAVALNELVTCTLRISNAGGRTASNVVVQSQLPSALTPVSTEGWTVDGQTLRTTVATLPANATAQVSFQVRVTKPGFWTCLGQLQAAGVGDPDSTPGNGFVMGEDDEAQADLRSW